MKNALKARLFNNEGFNAKRQTRKFLKWAENYNPDVLHLHNLHGYYINVELLFKWIKSRPNMKVLWTLHDCWAFTGHCTHFEFVNCSKWEKECHNCSQKKIYPKSLLMEKSKSNYERKKKAFCNVKDLQIITPSHWLKGVADKSFLKEYKITVVNNGIDLSVFKPTKSDFREKYNLKNKKIILGVASVWTQRKGFYDFIKLSKIIDENTHIVLAGVNDKQLKILPKNVLGFKKTFTINELAEIYSASDVLFNPTYEDTYPTVNLEAQACKTPVITYKTGGSVESVPENNVINKGDYKELIVKLKQDLPILEIKNNKQDFCLEYLKFYKI